MISSTGCVRRGEIDSTEVNKSEIKKCREEVEMYKSKYSDLEKEKNNLYEEMMAEVNRLEEEIHDLKNVNKELAGCVELLEKTDSLNCLGKKIPELGNKQKGRKLRLLKNKAQCALWFCKSFGLTLSHIKFQDEADGKYSVDYQGDHTSELDQSDKHNLEKILFCWTNFVLGMKYIMNFHTYQKIYPSPILSNN